MASVLVGGRWLILLLWLVVALGALWRLPALSTGGGGLGDITSADNPALVVEGRSARDFGFPLLSRILVVQHDPQGLPAVAVRDAVAAAARLDTGPQAPVQAALPLPADERLPGVRRPGTTVVTLLYPRPDQGLSDALAGAREYAAQLDGPQDRLVGVTGTAAARAEQVEIVNSSLRTLEVASAAAVLLIVGLAFRSLAAPAVTAAVAAVAFVAVTRSAAFLASREGWNIPADLEPLMVALMLGVVTDYVVYFLSAMRAELADGHGRVEAARRTTAIFAPIVVVAGLTVAAGVLALLLASSPPVRAFGPALALTVTVTLIVAVTLVPAAMAVLGPRCFWPSSPSRVRTVTVGGRMRRGVVRVVRRRIGALVVAAACVAGLLLAAEPIRELRAGWPLVASLPADNDVHRAARAAADGFGPGIISPTLVEVRAQDEPVAAGAFERLQALLAEQPHVARVLGPREDATVSDLAGRARAVFVTADGTAARYLLMLDVDPLDATAVGAVDLLDRRLPALLSRAGVPASATHGLGGDTAAVAAVVTQNERDLTRILVAALVVNLLLLALFLRALVAPLFLLACTVLSAAATLGVTVVLFQERLGHPGVTFFVPLAAGVLLLALGSDYNLFAVGHVWAQARRQRLQDAMLDALPQSSAAITTAGVALAASLGTLALVPLRQFRELAFALVVGILIDALVVRTLLAPSLLTLFGTASGWPGRRLHAPPPPDPPAGVAPDAARPPPGPARAPRQHEETT